MSLFFSFPFFFFFSKTWLKFMRSDKDGSASQARDRSRRRTDKRRTLADLQKASPGQRYAWIDRGIRRSFQFRKPCLTAVEEVEQQIAAHFVADSSLPLQIEEDDGYRRLLIHAVAQYHGLLSSSIDGQGPATGRTTLVTLARGLDAYVSPSTSLASWLTTTRVS